MAKHHEKFVKKVEDLNVEHFEQGETVDAAVEGQTGRVRQSPVFAIVDGVRRMSGGLQGRVVILTDSNLYVGRNGIKPEQIHFNLPQGRFAKRLAESASPATS